MPPGPPGTAQRRSSYAAVLSGIGTGPVGGSPHPRAGDLSFLLNVDNSPNDDSHSTPRQLHNGAGSYGNGVGNKTGSWGNGQLMDYHRQFAGVMNGHSGESNTDGFFTPSYLRGSSYIRTLEAQHKAKLAAKHEAVSQPPTVPRGIISKKSSNSNMSGFSALKAAPSHRGVSFDLVEKLPPLEADVLSQLPTRWSGSDKNANLEVLDGGLEVKVTAISKDKDLEAYTVRTDHAMPPECGIYYFEVTIMSSRSEGIPPASHIYIGFCGREVPLNRPPGWEKNSWAYHGDDGNAHLCHQSGKKYGKPFAQGDVVGCGINFHTGQAFFTRNGHNLGYAFREVKGVLFPCIALKKHGDHVRVNFGQQPFVFQIDDIVRREKEKIDEQVRATSTEKLAPPLDERTLIQSLVLQYLSHEGYCETALEFAAEVREEKKALTIKPEHAAETALFDYKEEADAGRRQEIRKAMLGGEVDKALQLMQEHYPAVLEDYEHIHFRLRCRKFLEMVVAAAAMFRRMESLESTSVSRGNYDYDTDTTQSMEIDGAGSSNQHAERNGTHGHDDDQMDTDGTSDGRRLREVAEQEHKRLLHEAIAYGRELKAMYASDPRKEIERAIDEIAAVLAYDDPVTSPEVCHLFKQSQRVTVAEELNSAILVHLGKSPEAAIERLVRQTVHLNDMLRENGGPGSFVNVFEYMKPQES